jgi:hypothetical protein
MGAFLSQTPPIPPQIQSQTAAPPMLQSQPPGTPAMMQIGGGMANPLDLLDQQIDALEQNLGNLSQVVQSVNPAMGGIVIHIAKAGQALREEAAMLRQRAEGGPSAASAGPEATPTPAVGPQPRPS